MKERVTVEEAVKVLGRSKQEIRKRLRLDYIRGKHDFPVGYAYPTESGKTFSCELYKGLIMKHVGLEEWTDENQRVTPEEAEKILKISPTRIRNLLKLDYLNKTNRFPVGFAYKSATGNSYQFDLYKPLIMKRAGLDKWPEGDEQDE